MIRTLHWPPKWRSDRKYPCETQPFPSRFGTSEVDQPKFRVNYVSKFLDELNVLPSRFI